MKYLLVIITLIAVMLGFMYQIESNDHATTKLALSSSNKKYVELENNILTQNLESVKKIRELESTIQTNTELYKKEVNVIKTKASIDRAKYNSSTAGMRSDIEALASSASKACGNTSSAGLREAAYDPIGVFAYVLGRLDRRTEVLADVATERGIAGTACEVEYENVRHTLNQ